MKSKILALAISLTLITTLGTALEIEHDADTPIQLEPDESIDIEFSLESFEDEEVTDIEITDIESEEIDVGPAGFQTEIDETPGDIELEYEASEETGSEIVNVTFTGERNNTDVSATTELEIVVEEPLTELFSGWVNEEQQFSTGGETYMINDIETSVFLEGLNQQEYEAQTDELTELDNDEHIEVHQTITSDVLGTENSVAEFTVYSEDEDASFELSELETVQECELDLELRTGSQLNRGQQNIFATVDQETSESVPEVEVIITQQDGGEVVDTFITDDFGRHTYTMPEQVESDSLIFTFEYLGDEPEFEDCDPNERVIEFDQTYEDWLEGEESFQLDMEINETMKNYGEMYGNITGQAFNQEGEEVENPVLEVEGPQDEEVQVSGSTFNYQPPETGEYEVRLSKSGYLESEWQTVDYQDQCPEIDGLVEAEGCEEEAIFLSFYDADNNIVNEEELEPNEQYRIEVEDETGELLEEFNEEMDIVTADGETAGQIEFEEGVGRASFEGQGRIEFDGNNRFEPVSNSVTAQSGISTIWLILAGIIGVLLVIAIIIIIALGSKESSGRNAPTNMSGGGTTTNSDTKIRLSGSGGDE